MKKAELIAPAGGPEIFLAVCEARPDAIYAGLRGFGDSPHWRGFTLSELSALIPHARSRGIQVHLSIDTVIREDELTGLLDQIIGAVELQPDFIVVQDAGLLRLIKQFFPAQRVQAGLGFTIHNHEGVKFARSLGADRVALLPEVHINDIGRIVRKTGAEIELLVHGPLGYALSGQCLFSSYMDGNSANRGRCSRPCLETFQNGRYTGRPFATRELSALSILLRLAHTGAAALRIAGRAKSSEEIIDTIRSYRSVLETSAHPEREVRHEANHKRRSSGTEDRKINVGYYLGGNTNLLDPNAESRSGVYIGQVQQMNEDTIGITPEKGVRIGDKLEIRPARGGESHTFIVKELFLRNKRMRSGRIGEMIRIGVPRVFRKGDEVYRLPMGKSSLESSNRTRELLRSLKPRRRSLSLHLNWRSPKLEIATELNGQPFSVIYEYQPVEKSSAGLGEALRNHFEPPKSSPFELGEFRSNQPGGLWPGEWEIKSMATNFYRAVETELTNRQQALRREVEIAVCKTGHHGEESPLDEVMYRVHLPHANALADLKGEEDAIYSLDFSPRRLESIREALKKSAVGLERLAFVLPPWMWEGELAGFRDAVESLAAQGARTWYLGNAGQIGLLDGLGLTCAAGPAMACYNSYAVRHLRRAGVKIVSVPVEDDGSNWGRLAARSAGVILEAPIYGHPALFISRSRPDHAGDQTVLKMAGGPPIRFHRAESWSEVRTAEPVSLLGQRQELCNMGFRRFLIDFTGEAWNLPRFQEILDSARSSRSIEGAGMFNYRRGLI